MHRRTGTRHGTLAVHGAGTPARRLGESGFSVPAQAPRGCDRRGARARTARLSPCFAPETMMWSIADLLPRHLARPEFAPIRSYLADDERGVKRIQLAERIANTFDQYVVYRPKMVLGWESGAGRTGKRCCGARWSRGTARGTLPPAPRRSSRPSGSGRRRSTAFRLASACSGFRRCRPSTSNCWRRCRGWWRCTSSCSARHANTGPTSGRNAIYCAP